MSLARRSHGAPQAVLWRAAPRIAGFVVVALAAGTHAFADVPHPRDAITGSPLLTSPAQFPTGAVVATSNSPAHTEAQPGTPARTEASGRAAGARPASPAWLNRLSRKSQRAAPDGWWLGMGGMALALAICGAIGIAARRFSPRVANGAIQVVGRVSLSPKHTVYLLRVGQRVLLIGAGPQGAPALLGELDELPEASLSSEEGGEP